jgi:hypothetical protein
MKKKKWYKCTNLNALIIINFIIENFGWRNKMNSLIFDYIIKISKLLILMNWLKPMQGEKSFKMTKNKNFESKIEDA